MPRCDQCGKNVSLPFHCQYCGKNFCDDCRLPPNHACAGLAAWKKTPAPGVGIRYGSGGTSAYGGGYPAAAPAGTTKVPAWKRPAVKIALVAAVLILLVVIFMLLAGCVQRSGAPEGPSGMATVSPAPSVSPTLPATTETSAVLNTTAAPAGTTAVPVHAATTVTTSSRTAAGTTTGSPPFTPVPANISADPYTISPAGLADRIHALVNAQRAENGLPSLAHDEALRALALGHSTDMAANNYFSHTDLFGNDPTARGNATNLTCRKDYGSYYTYGIAENIYQNNLYTSVTLESGIYSYAWSTQEEIAQSTVAGWMDSEGHRKNILSSTYGSEGIGVAISADDKVYITEDFC